MKICDKTKKVAKKIPDKTIASLYPKSIQIFLHQNNEGSSVDNRKKSQLISERFRAT